MVDIKYYAGNDCYAILGARTGCDEATLRRQYKMLLLELHPDKQPPSARTEFHEPLTRMQNAYDIVIDPYMRRGYDTAREKHFRTIFNTSNLQVTFEPWMATQDEAIRDAEDKRARKRNFARREREQEMDVVGGSGGPAPQPPGPIPQEIARLEIGDAAAPILAQGVNYGPYALANTFLTLLGFGPTHGVVIWLTSISVTSLNQLLNMIPIDFTDPPPRYVFSDPNEMRPVSFIEIREIRKLIAFNNVNFNHNGGHMVDLEACDLNMYQAFTPHYDPHSEYLTLPQISRREAAEQHMRLREAQQRQWEEQRNCQGREPPKKEGESARSRGDESPGGCGGGDSPLPTPQERARAHLDDPIDRKRGNGTAAAMVANEEPKRNDSPTKTTLVCEVAEGHDVVMAVEADSTATPTSARTDAQKNDDAVVAVEVDSNAATTSAHTDAQKNDDSPTQPTLGSVEDATIQGHSPTAPSTPNDTVVAVEADSAAKTTSVQTDDRTMTVWTRARTSRLPKNRKNDDPPTSPDSAATPTSVTTDAQKSDGSDQDTLASEQLQSVDASFDAPKKKRAQQKRLVGSHSSSTNQMKDSTVKNVACSAARSFSKLQKMQTYGKTDPSDTRPRIESYLVTFDSLVETPRGGKGRMQRKTPLCAMMAAANFDEVAAGRKFQQLGNELVARGKRRAGILVAETKKKKQKQAQLPSEEIFDLVVGEAPTTYIDSIFGAETYSTAEKRRRCRSGEAESDNEDE